MQKVKLNNGREMPVLGLGTFQLNENVDQVVNVALDCGYRSFDTAEVYKNEEDIGRTLKKWLDAGRGKREDLFITTKLPPTGVRGEVVEDHLRGSLKRLQLDYIDLYLIHAPFGIKEDKSGSNPFGFALNPDGSLILDYQSSYLDTWKAMEKMVCLGLVKSIGISNFNETQILNILKHATIKPSNLQIEMSVYLQQKPLLEFCKKQGISVTGYGTLGSAGFHDFKSATAKAQPKQLDHPAILKIAKTHKKTPAQVLIRHSIQTGIIVIPKSGNLDRVRQNINVFDFELTESEMKELETLEVGEKARMFDFTTMLIGIENHPDFPFTNSLKL